MLAGANFMHGPVRCVAPIGTILGEGPVWSHNEAALWFVDIKGQSLHRFHPESGAHQRWPTPSPPGWILPVQGGGWLVGLKTGLYRFDLNSGDFTLFSLVEQDLPNNRLNDATTGPDGRLWFGTMDDHERADSGRIYQLSQSVVTDSGLPPVCITNGPALSPNGNILYHTDTLAGIIYASNLDDNARVTATRPFAEILSKDGYPDGPIVDSLGYVWTGLFAGWGVRRYSPSGELVAHIAFPVANVTKLAFGGPNLTTLYATTATKGLSEAQLHDQPLAGGLFMFETDMRGLLPAPLNLDL
jgi:xylono-1,5-lactonase